ncbi:hypothetical protein [Largemouth bass virus]|nr:hypothetical protein [Largemouth bass virus]
MEGSVALVLGGICVLILILMTVKLVYATMCCRKKEPPKRRTVVSAIYRPWASGNPLPEITV